MKLIFNKIRQITGGILLLIILGLLIVIQFKNGSIKNLKQKVAEKPKIEYIYNTDTITTIDAVVDYKYKVVYKDKIVIETDSIPVELTQADSAQIAEAYSKLYVDYNSTTIYDDVLKDDSLAYIKLYEEVSKNEITKRQLDYQDRTPVIHITTPIVQQDKTFSIIGGLEGSIGNGNSLSVGAGIVSVGNRVYTFSYDPFTQQKRVTVYFPIFNIRK